MRAGGRRSPSCFFRYPREAGRDTRALPRDAARTVICHLGPFDLADATSSRQPNAVTSRAQHLPHNSANAGPGSVSDRAPSPIVHNLPSLSTIDIQHHQRAVVAHCTAREISAALPIPTSQREREQREVDDARPRKSTCVDDEALSGLEVDIAEATEHPCILSEAARGASATRRDASIMCLLLVLGRTGTSIGLADARVRFTSSPARLGPSQ